MMPQQYCLRWKHHHSNVQSMFSQLLEKERFCDVTLYCSPSFGAQIPENGASIEPDHIRGVSLRAHRVVLAACSEMLASLLGAHEAHGEPVLVIDGAEPRHVRQLLDYMYTGEMNVHHSQLASLLKTAEELRIKGLSDIRWNNKDEPPDCNTGAVMATTADSDKQNVKKDNADENKSFNINGGPPPLIKLPPKEKASPGRKRELNVDSDVTRSPKCQRMTSFNDQTDEDDRDQEWQHGNLDISAERVVQWGEAGGGCEGEGSGGSWEGERLSDEEWADAPTDIGSFLHTRLRVDGDNSADEDSEEDTGAASSGSAHADVKMEPMKPLMHQLPKLLPKPPGMASKGATSSDSRFPDVIKLNEYLLHGRRPQFWEEDYVKRVMEAVRLKELEMKQAAEILGVSYGTLYGRYRDVYGCINRPYRNARDFWAGKGTSEVLDRIQRNEISLDIAAQALGMSSARLVTYLADAGPYPGLPATTTPPDDVAPPGARDEPHDVAFASCLPEIRTYGKMTEEFDPIPIEIDPSLKKKALTTTLSTKTYKKCSSAAEKAVKKILIGSLNDEDPIPATVISTQDGKKNSKDMWPSIRVANIESLRGSTSSSSAPDPTSPTLLMKTRPDLTIVAAKKPDSKREEENGT